MIDKDLTINRGLSEIGDITTSGQTTLTSRSPFTKAIGEYRTRIAELLEQKLVENIQAPEINGGGIHPCDWLEEKYKLEIEIGKLRDRVFHTMTRTVYSTLQPPTNRDILYYEPFVGTLKEAIGNAVEHGTNFCTQGTVKVQTWTGERGLLGVVSQKTPGLTQEQIDGEPLIQGTRRTETRGRGLSCYKYSKHPEVGFELYTEQSPIFRVIILETRQELRGL